jgi:hypothetical protein
MKIIVGLMIDNNLNKFCMLLEMSKINYDCLLTEIILLYNSQRINGFLFLFLSNIMELKGLVEKKRYISTD